MNIFTTSQFAAKMDSSEINLFSLHEPLLIFMLLTGLQYQSMLVSLISFFSLVAHVRKKQTGFEKNLVSIMCSPLLSPPSPHSTTLLLIRLFNHFFFCLTFGLSWFTLSLILVTRRTIKVKGLSRHHRGLLNQCKLVKQANVVYSSSCV